MADEVIPAPTAMPQGIRERPLSYDELTYEGVMLQFESHRQEEQNRRYVALSLLYCQAVMVVVIALLTLGAFWHLLHHIVDGQVRLLDFAFEHIKELFAWGASFGIHQVLGRFRKQADTDFQASRVRLEEFVKQIRSYQNEPGDPPKRPRRSSK